MDNKNYVVKLKDGSYYSRNVFWKGTTLDKATYLTHKEAIKIRNHLCQPRINQHAVIEKLK